MRTTIVLAFVSTLLSFAAATPAGSLSEPNTNALLPLGARSALKGCFEQCGNNAQCGGACNHCSAGRCHTWAKRDEEVVSAPVSLPRSEDIAQKGCFEQCSNNGQCSGACPYCSAGRCHTWKRDDSESEVVAAPISLPRAEAIAQKGCFQQCSNNSQCSGVCNRCSQGRCHTWAKRDEELSE